MTNTASDPSASEDAAAPHTQAAPVMCPICGAVSNVAVGTRCRGCSTDLSHPAVAMLVDSDAAIAQCQRAYDELSARWVQWNEQRALLVRQLQATRAVPAAYADFAAPVSLPAADAAPPEPGPWGGAPAVAAAASTVPAVATAASTVQPAAHQPASTTINRRTPRSLTAPVLLGIAGAALLITAVVVFVAATWTTFNPVAQGLLILALAGAVGYGALLLTKHRLAVSGGAVGVVSTAFAGVSVLAFDRAAGLLGTGASAGALFITAVAGYALSRLAVHWVHSFAALALVGAGVAAVIAVVAPHSGDGRPWIGVAGAVAGLAVSATYPVWRGSIAPRIVRYGTVAGVTVAGLGAIVVALPDLHYFPVTGKQDLLGEVLGLVAPLVVLLVWHTWWPRFVAAPLGLVAPASVGVLVGFTAVPWWCASAAGALAAMALVWRAGRWPGTRRVPLLWGLIPVALYLIVFAAVSLGAASGYTAAVLVAGTAFAFNGAAGAVAVVAGGGMLAFRSWSLPAVTRRSIELIGSLVVTAGVWAIAVGAADSLGATGRVVLSFTLMGAAVVTFATRWCWRERAARKATAVSAVMLTTVAGLLGSGALALDEGQGSLWQSLVATALPIAILIVGAYWRPSYAVGSATLLLTLAGLTAAIAGGLTGGLAATIPVAVAAVIAWGLNLVPRTWRSPGGVGLIPVLACGFLVVILSIFPALSGLVADMPPVDLGDYGWATLIGALTVVAVAGVGHKQDALARASEPLGAISILATLVVATAWARVAVPDPWVASLAAFAVALAVAATAAMWRGAGARTTVRMGAGVWLVGQVLVAIGDMAFGDGRLGQSLVPAVIGVALLVVVKSWLPLTHGPAAFALALLVPATVYAFGGSTGAVTFSLAAAVGGLVWVARALVLTQGTSAGRPLGYGLALPSVGVGAAVVVAAGVGLFRYQQTILGGHVDGPHWWTVGIILAFSAGALAWRRVRDHWQWIGLIATFIAGGAVSPLVGAVSLMVFAGALIVVVVTNAGGLASTKRRSQWFALGGATLAIGWAAQDSWGVAVTAALAAAVAWWIAVSSTVGSHERPGAEWPQQDGTATRGSSVTGDDLAIAIAVVASSLATGTAALSGGSNERFALVAAVAVAVSSIVVARRRGYESDAWVSATLLGLVTVVAPFFADSVRGVGLVMLVSAVGWWTFRIMGWRAATWVAVTTTSIGAALTLASAGIGVVEAYFATPAVCGLAIGLWELRAHPETRTLAALSPGLAVALIPSYLAMISLPDQTVRVLILAVVTLMLAVAGVAARWFAPVLAACITAVVIALTQVLVTNSAGVRWIAFAVVGVLLLVIAATFEKLKELR